ncbi:MAG TPA: YggT family protein [Gemmatimonadales bacterium]|nr:YggT family protein [Gemmatimonadales bacterium]
MPPFFTVVRYVVFAVVALSALVALGSWLVRTRRVSPFSALGRGLRSSTDSILRPLERRIVRMGGNPAHAGGWLIVTTAIAGIVLVSLLGWLMTTFESAQAAAVSGPRATISLIVDLVYRIVSFALLVRVIASWFGLHRYSPWLRPAYILTDWIVEPIRRIVPPLGALDISPLVAWFALWLIRTMIQSFMGI